MSTVTETVVLPYTQAPETSENLDWADLATLDLSKYDQPNGKQELADQFRQAMEEIGKYVHFLPCSHVAKCCFLSKGFFYVKNHGLSDEDIDKQLVDIRGMMECAFGIH